MNLNLPIAITQANYSELERDLRAAKTSPNKDGFYSANFLYVRAEEAPVTRVGVLWVEQGLLAFRSAGINIATTPKSQVMRGDFIPLEDRLRYKENPNRISSDGVRWAAIANGSTHVIWVPEDYSVVKAANGPVLSAVRKLGKQYKKYDASFVSQALDNAYGHLNQ